MALTIDYQPVLDTADLFRRVDRELAAKMRRDVTRDVNPWLQSAIRRKGGAMAQDARIAGSARVRSGANPAVVVGGSGRFAGGATTAELVRVYEFGGYRDAVGTYRGRSPRGTAYTVTRRTQRQIPYVNRTGRFVYPSVAEAAPMLVRAWVATIVDAYEGRG
jgi:hypothetical protein